MAEIDTDTRHPLHIAASPESMLEPMTVLNPLISYPLEQIDPTAVTTQDQSETLLPMVRPVLYLLQKACPGLCDPTHAGSLAAALAPTVAPVARAAVHDAVFKPAASWRPFMCLFAPTARLMPPSLADRIAEMERVQCIPVLNDPHQRVALPGYPLAMPRRVLFSFPRRRVGGARDAVAQLDWTAEDRVRLSVRAPTGAEATFEGEADARLLARLFRPAVPSPETFRLRPELPGELPGPLTHAIADFWQRHVRAHVIASVCSPPDSARPLAFSSITAKREGGAESRLTIRGTLAPSSTPCACALHGITPVETRFPSERFVRSEVQLVLSMCGRPIGANGECKRHGQGTPIVDLLPTTCTHHTTAALFCTHHTAQKTDKTGLCITHFDHVRGANLLHAQVLLATAGRSVEVVEPLVRKRQRDEADEASDAIIANAARKLGEVERRRALEGCRPDRDEMHELDCHAHALLTEGTVRQHKRVSTGEVVLARECEGGGTSILNVDDGAALCDTHLGLFRRPPGKRR